MQRCLSNKNRIFKQFKEDFNLPYFDIANSNIDRVCYESFDTNIYINFDAELYNPIIEEKGFHIKEKSPILSSSAQISSVWAGW